MAGVELPRDVHHVTARGKVYSTGSLAGAPNVPASERGSRILNRMPAASWAKVEALGRATGVSGRVGGSNADGLAQWQ